MEMTLQKHLKYLHTGQKHHKCEECSDAFETLKQLNTHKAEKMCLRWKVLAQYVSIYAYEEKTLTNFLNANFYTVEEKFYS